MSRDPGDYSVSAEIMAVAQAAKAKSRSARLAFGKDRVLFDAYQRVFFRNGQLTPEAQIVLNDLIDIAGIGKAAGGLEHEELACLEGKRRLVLHLFGRFRLNAARVENLNHQLSQEEET